MKKLICTVCPKGCHLTVDIDNDYKVTGNQCDRGIVFGQNEVKNPMRTLTSTVTIAGGIYGLCPVKTDSPIPRGLQFKAIEEINKISLTSPVKNGQIIIKNICGTDSNIVSTRDM